MAGKSFIFSFADIEIREREFRLIKAGEVLPVEPKAFRVLLFLLRNPGKLIEKEELLNAVWGDAAVTDNSLARSIALLRRLLGDDPHHPRFIETVSTVGYRLVCPVEAVEDVSLKPELEVQPATPNAGSVQAAQTAPTAASASVTSRTRRRRRLWLTLGATGFAAFLAVGFWYLRRPLSPPRITKYTQITHDGVLKSMAATDGTRLYFNYDDNSPDPIAEVSETGGAITHIPVPFKTAAWVEDVSPDGSNFLIQTNERGDVADRPQWNLRVPGGSLHSLPDAQWVALSPDGNTVAYFNTAAGDIWLVRSDGSGAHKLTSFRSGAGDQTWSWGLAWSPDGSAIRFFKDNRLWEISSSGSNLHQVLPGSPALSGPCCGKWAPDGKFFVFLNNYEPNAPAQIWALDERRGLFQRSPAGPFQLTTGPIDWNWFVFSRNGKTIFSTGNTYRAELSRFDLRSGQFLPYLGGISAQGVSYSKDGRFVAYVSYPEGVLWRANRDGSNPVQLTDPPILAFMPRWSPDGTQILFADFVGGGFIIDVVPAAGGSPQRLLPEEKGPQGDPNWSADGRRIVFSSRGDPGSKGDLRILDLATHEITTVPGSAGTYSPRRSPDGRFIAALSDDQLGLKIFDVETQRWSSEWRMKDVVSFPEWSRDSQSIYFIHGISSSDTGVFRIRVRGGETERIADLKNVHLGGWFNLYMGLDPTDAPLVVREVGTSEIYALTLDYK